MAQFRVGNLFNAIDAKTDLFITTNRIIKKDGTLVMGRGVALEAVKRFPEIAKLFAEHINTFNKDSRRYYLIPPVPVESPKNRIKIQNLRVGAIQTKIHWRDPSPQDLVQSSLRHLDAYAIQNRDRKIHCALVGTENGGLDIFAVMLMCKELPDNVRFWFTEDFIKSKIESPISVEMQDKISKKPIEKRKAKK